MTGPIVETNDLSKSYTVGANRLYAVDNVSLHVMPGETLGLVGESGCGKTTLGRCIVRLQDGITGSLRFDGQETATLSQPKLRPLRKRFQMVFQDPYTSLNPRRRVGDQIADPLRIHCRLDRASLQARVKELLGLVGLAEDHADRFPHELSGGQCQRVGIARAVALEPDLLVLDEAVSALDVSVQAQIINLLLDLQDKLGLTYIFISHNLSVVRQVSRRVAVMYLGSIIEIGTVEDIFDRAAHPYTMALLSAIPTVFGDQPYERILLEGDLPSPMSPPSGCRFHPRCPIAQDRCKVERPTLTAQRDGHQAACHYPGGADRLAARPA